QVSELKGGKVTSYEITPMEFGIRKSKPGELKGGDASQNAKIAIAVLSGEKGPQRDIVIINAGCAIYAADGAKSIKEGIEIAEESIESGEGLKKLEQLKEATDR
ncbi:MAG: anthranilate phosphoribosyltransferase, partial [Candidatus Omnitrophota bacterium]